MLSIVVGDKKSLLRRFLALLSLNQSFSGSGKILSPFSRLESGTFSRFPRSAELSARTVGVIRRGEDSSIFSITTTKYTGELATRLSAAHPHPAHIFCSNAVSLIGADVGYATFQHCRITSQFPAVRVITDRCQILAVNEDCIGCFFFAELVKYNPCFFRGNFPCWTNEICQRISA